MGVHGLEESVVLERHELAVAREVVHRLALEHHALVVGRDVAVDRLLLEDHEPAIDRARARLRLLRELGDLALLVDDRARRTARVAALR